MNVSSVWRRLKQGDLAFLLGRFMSVRRGYTMIRGLRTGLFSDLQGIGSPGSALFHGLDIDKAVDELRREAVFLGLTLPPPIVREIEQFCREQPLFARHEPDGGAFFHREILHGHRADGRPVAVGAITDPLRCGAVRAVQEDAVLRSIVRRYLGYEPTRIMTLLYWSFCSSFSEAERRSMLQHVIDYHYDVGGYNFVYVSFYVLDTKRTTGAHIMVRGSHRGKSLRMLLGSTTAPEEAVYRQFGQQNELVIEGPGGTGFIQDASCFHRASPPTTGDRLLLQFRFR